MMMRSFFTFFFLALTLSMQAQTAQEDVLFTVDDDAVYASEFIRVFNKNLDLVKDESQKDVDQYLELFVNYKLKLKEAKTLKLDESPTYNRELANYKKQLSKNYLSDSKVTNELVVEAYERMTKEVKASHILIKLNESASPQDTLKAYNDLLKLRDRVIKEGFDQVKKEKHNGKTVFAEDLGYFSGFKMVYDFENVAFNTPVGEVSNPFRTQFGYHIIYVQDVRKSRGEITVAHIMVSDKKKDTISNNLAESRIQDIYKKLQQGEDFEALAKQFSDDKSSAVKGGELASFSSGQLSSSEFEEQAFAIKNINDYTQPFKTSFGWHIVKLINKKDVASLEEMTGELETKVKRDSRSKLINTSRINTLKQRYSIEANHPDLTYFETILNDNYFKGSWKIPSTLTADEILVTIKDEKLSYQDFADFILKSQRRSMPKRAFSKIISDLYDAFLNNNLLAYQEANLETENKEFAYVLSEYRDGLLLFDLMDKQIWNAAKTDTTQIEAFYNTHKEQYFFNERVNATVASSAKKSVVKKAALLLEENESLESIKENLNTDTQVNVIFTTGVMDKNHQALPRNFSFKKGISKVQKHNKAFVVVKVDDVLPRTLKTFEEAKGTVISDYQDQKEKAWLEGLHKKYKVEVNEAVLSEVKKQIKK